MKTWRVAVLDNGQKYYYIVDAEDKGGAEARAYSLHCSTPNWNPGRRASVQDSETQEWTGA